MATTLDCGSLFLSPLFLFLNRSKQVRFYIIQYMDLYSTGETIIHFYFNIIFWIPLLLLLCIVIVSTIIIYQLYRSMYDMCVKLTHYSSIIIISSWCWSLTCLLARSLKSKQNSFILLLFHKSVEFFSSSLFWTEKFIGSFLTDYWPSKNGEKKKKTSNYIASYWEFFLYDMVLFERDWVNSLFHSPFFFFSSVLAFGFRSNQKQNTSQWMNRIKIESATIPKTFKICSVRRLSIVFKWIKK